VFADPPERPVRFDYRSIDPDFAVYGWRVRVDRPALEFAELLDAGRGGFTLTGSGNAVVRTARVTRPGGLLRATIRTAADTVVVVRRADRRGRIRLPVALGPGNPRQQHAPGASTTVHRARIALRPVKEDR
jgi:hypothetical protein